MYTQRNVLAADTVTHHVDVQTHRALEHDDAAEPEQSSERLDRKI